MVEGGAKAFVSKKMVAATYKMHGYWLIVIGNEMIIPGNWRTILVPIPCMTVQKGWG